MTPTFKSNFESRHLMQWSCHTWQSHIQTQHMPLSQWTKRNMPLYFFTKIFSIYLKETFFNSLRNFVIWNPVLFIKSCGQVPKNSLQPHSYIFVTLWIKQPNWKPSIWQANEHVGFVKIFLPTIVSFFTHSIPKRDVCNFILKLKAHLPICNKLWQSS